MPAWRTVCTLYFVWCPARIGSTINQASANNPVGDHDKSSGADEEVFHNGSRRCHYLRILAGALVAGVCLCVCVGGGPAVGVWFF